MKKVFSLIAVAIVATMVSCGPSAEEKAKLEERLKFMEDSTKAAIEAAMNAATNAATATADSAAAITETAATTATVAAEAKH
jgi:hypothetical protein